MPYNKKRQIEADSDGEPQAVKKSKSEKQGKKALTQGKDAEGNSYWEVGSALTSHSTPRYGLLTPPQVGSNRRISASQFKGATLINIREYYTAPDGDLRPGKKVGSAHYEGLLQH